MTPGANRSPASPINTADVCSWTAHPGMPPTYLTISIFQLRPKGLGSRLTQADPGLLKSIREECNIAASAEPIFVTDVLSVKLASLYQVPCLNHSKRGQLSPCPLAEGFKKWDQFIHLWKGKERHQLLLEPKQRFFLCLLLGLSKATRAPKPPPPKKKTPHKIPKTQKFQRVAMPVCRGEHWSALIFRVKAFKRSDKAKIPGKGSFGSWQFILRKSCWFLRCWRIQIQLWSFKASRNIILGVKTQKAGSHPRSV